MNFREFLSDRQAVSPVIGVILMVAITVILAAVIGTFVLGLGDQVNNNAPQASFEYDFASDSEVTITHTGGDTLTDSNLKISVGGSTAYVGAGNENAGDAGTTDFDSSPWTNANSLDNWGSDISAGDDVTLNANGNDQSGNTIRIVWENPSGGSTNTISSQDWP